MLACGLAVTLGLMNFVNLAHGAFAMAGGYCLVVLVNRAGLPFFAALPAAFLFSAVLGFVLERTLYVHLYRKPHLDQVLFTIGLVFMSVAGVDYVMGSGQVFARLPTWLEGQFNLFGVGLGRYRLLIIVICGLLTIGCSSFCRAHASAAGAASVDDARVARGSASTYRRVWFTFAPAHLAGLGGALGVEILGLDPTFPLKYRSTS